MTKQKERSVVKSVLTNERNSGKTLVLKHALEVTPLRVVMFWVGPTDPLEASSPLRVTGAYGSSKVLEALRDSLTSEGYQADILNSESATRVIEYHNQLNRVRRY